jgi:hypothetical protein
LDTLLAQDYGCLELIISDNASTDGTEEICRAYAARDSRIQYHREERNRGAVWNFNRVFHLSRGKYFMWAAHDDRRHPRYVSSCVAALEDSPRAILCCTGLRLMDEAGKEIREADFPHGIRPVGRSPGDRVGAVARATFWYDFYGLIRRDRLTETGLCQPIWGFDVLLLMELCLRGEVVLVPEKLWEYRVFAPKTNGDLAKTLGPNDGVPSIPVEWTRLSQEMFRSIWRAPLANPTKLLVSWQFLLDFCFSNSLVRWGIRRDAASCARSALREHRYLSALTSLAMYVPAVAGVAAGRARREANNCWSCFRRASRGDRRECP